MRVGIPQRPTRSPSCPRSPTGAGGDNRIMIRYQVDVGATRRHTFAVELHIAEPAAEQRLSLPVWIPGSYLVREFARHLSALAAEQGGARGAAASSSTRRPGGRDCDAGAAARRPLPGLRLRHLGARGLSRRARAASSTAPACACASKGREGEPHALALAACPRAGRSRRRSRRVPVDGSGREFVAADYDDAGRPSGRARPLLARPLRRRRRAARVRRRRRAARFRRRAAARRQPAHSARPRSRSGTAPARPPFERYVFMLNALEDGRGGLEHRSSTALVAPRRDLPRRAGAMPRSRPPSPRPATATSACSA